MFSKYESDRQGCRNACKAAGNGPLKGCTPPPPSRPGLREYTPAGFGRQIGKTYILFYTRNCDNFFTVVHNLDHNLREESPLFNRHMPPQFPARLKTVIVRCRLSYWGQLTWHPSSVFGYHAVLEVDPTTDWMIHWCDTRWTATSHHNHITCHHHHHYHQTQLGFINIIIIILAADCPFTHYLLLMFPLSPPPSRHISPSFLPVSSFIVHASLLSPTAPEATPHWLACTCKRTTNT